MSIVAQNGKLNVVYCPDCGFCHLDPLPAIEVIDRYYGKQDAFYTNSEQWFDKERREHARGLWDSAYKWQAELLGNTGLLLDIGAGPGWFVQWWIEYNRGWACGVEPSKTAREACPKWWRDTLYESLNDVPYYPYQQIRLSLVLEHIPNPQDFIKKLLPYLAIDGKLMIIVPNEFNPLQQWLRGKNGDWFVSHVHCNYFTPSGLRQLLKSVGLRIVFEGTTFPTEIFPLIGLNHIGNDKVGGRVHQARLWFEKVLGVRAFWLYTWLYRRWGIGRELVFVAEKQ